MRNTLHAALLISTFCFATSPALAELRLPNIFGDHMVLQQNKPIKVWGWAKPNTRVNVFLGEQSTFAKVDEKGRWLAVLQPENASFEPRTLKFTSGKEEIVINNVLIGEVWLCGGQSNMEWSLRGSRDADMELTAANYPAIRFIRLPKVASMTPRDDFPVESESSATGNWRQCIPEQVSNCTAVGYYFAKRLHRQLRVPVGLVDTSWGGTMAQHWSAKETLRKFPEMKPYFDQHEAKVKAWNEGGMEKGAKQRYEADLKAWEVKAAEAKENKQRAPRKPNPRSGQYTDPSGHHQPGGMINGCIHPIANFRFRGVLFYQGENNSFGESWKPYPKTCPAVISDWRKLLDEPDLPFGMVQIAGWSNRRSMTYDQNHHCNVVREVQFNTWRTTKHTGLIVSFDTNSNGSIHPGRKLPIGERSARWALSTVYDVKRAGSSQPLEWMGPVYSSYEIKDGKIIVSFIKGTEQSLRLDQDLDVGFYIAGADNVFHHARARITKSKDGIGQVEIWHDDINEPKAARYAISNLPIGGLMNGRELPAYPFRTDDWPITPHQSTGSYMGKQVTGK